MSPGPLGSTAYDDRGSGISSQTHHITMGSLTPTKAYLFDIISDSVIDDNGGVHYTQTTGPSITGPSSRLVFGRVLQEDSATAAAGAIVYLYVKDGDSTGTTGESQAFSALADGTGTWNQNIGTIRQQSLLAYFSITEGDQLCLEAQWENLSGDAMCVPIGETAPAANLVVGPIATASIPLVAGLNFIALPLEPMQSLKASTLAQAIAAQGGAVAQIDMWDESIGMWKSHIVGLEFNDFDIVLGRAYFLKVTLGVTWALKGHPLKAGVPLNLVTGLNGIGIPYSPVPLKFSRLAVEVAAQGGSIDQIDMWNQSLGRWESHKVGMAFNNFDIESWRGYFLKVTKGAAFDPGTIPVPSASGFDFGSPVTYSTWQQPFSAALVDMNGDSILDLAVAESAADTISVRRGNGDGTFQSPAVYPVGLGPLAIATADFDGDGRQDVATANNRGNSVSLLKGAGDGTLLPRVDFVAGNKPFHIVSADLNGDSRPDLAVTNNWGDSVSVLLNNGSGGFLPKVDYATADEPRGLAIADLNGDMHPDLAVAAATAGRVCVLVNNGDGTFRPRVDYVAGSGTRSVDTGDYNRDGYVDVAVSVYLGGVKVLLNNGDGTFGSATRYYAASGSRVTEWIEAADLNGDSYADLLTAASSSSNLEVLRNKGDGVFESAGLLNTGRSSTSVHAADLNGDGKLDLVTVNFNNQTVSVFLHQ
jgi:hypothetical protein